MAALYRFVGTVSWWLGVLSLVAGFVMKFVRPTGIRSLGMIPHNLLFFAGVLFLCTACHTDDGTSRHGEAIGSKATLIAYLAPG